MAGWPFKTHVFSAMSGLLSSYDRYLMNLKCLGRTIQTLLEVWHETVGNFLVGTLILGFLTIVRNRQASSAFEALNSTCLSICQRDVRLPFQKRQRPRASYMVSTGYSHIPSSCARKDQASFKRLQGNRAFFRVRA